MSATAACHAPIALPPSLHSDFYSVLASQLGRLTSDSAGRSAGGGPDVEPVDLNRLLEMVDDDPVQLREVVSMYLNESTKGIGELWASIQAGDWDQTERLAHRLCGTAAMCGMVGLVAPLRAIEIEAQSGRWSRLQILMLEARRQQGRVVDCLGRHGLKGTQQAATAQSWEEAR